MLVAGTQKSGSVFNHKANPEHLALLAQTVGAHTSICSLSMIFTVINLTLVLVVVKHFRKWVQSRQKSPPISQRLAGENNNKGKQVEHVTHSICSSFKSNFSPEN